MSRTTVYDWVQRGTLLAWKSTKRGLTIPAAQILGPGAVVAALAEVVEVIEDPKLAWASITQEWRFEDEAATPLELMKSGRIREVLCAAPGFGDTFMSVVRYPRNRIEPALLKGSLPASFRIVPARYLASPLGSRPADSRFCSRDAGYTVLYTSPDFATAFAETDEQRQEVQPHPESPRRGLAMTTMSAADRLCTKGLE